MAKSFTSVNVNRAILACSATNTGFIALARRPRSAFATGPSGGYALVTWMEDGDFLDVQAHHLSGPLAQASDGGDLFASARTGKDGFADLVGDSEGDFCPTATAIAAHSGPDELVVGLATADEATVEPEEATTVSVREIREGHDDVVWMFGDLGDLDAIIEMRRARNPGSPGIYAREMSFALRDEGVSTYFDSTYVVESAATRKAGRRAIDGRYALVSGAYKRAVIDLFDVDDLAGFVGTPRHQAGYLLPFGAQLSVNGSATYRELVCGPSTFDAEPEPARALV